MRLTHRRIAIAGVAVATSVALGTTAVPATPPVPHIVEINVTHSTDFSSGEPEIAINPKNPNNMVYVATYYTLDRVGAGGAQYELPYAVASFGLVFGIEHCAAYYTMDRGLHWHPTPWPQGARRSAATRWSRSTATARSTRRSTGWAAGRLRSCPQRRPTPTAPPTRRTAA